jgi:hypothetical protein
MLLLVAHAPGEAWWAAKRLGYGVVPRLLGCILATICGRIAVSRPVHQLGHHLRIDGCDLLAKAIGGNGSSLRDLDP